MVILPLSPGEATPGEHCAQFWVSYYKRDLELLERVLQRATRMIKLLSYDERLRELGLFYWRRED